jgi:hypothetical protein
MLYVSKPEKVFLYCGVVDFRKQINGLCYIVESELAEENFERSWFVFIARDQKKVKILYWRGSGLALWQYRLEAERFNLGKPRCVVSRNISWKKLARFLDGYNIFQGDPHEQIEAKRLS